MKQTGVLLVNLGSPVSTSIPDVRRYLREFLMDGSVIDVPFPIRWAIVHLAILPFRPSRTAEAYQKIWTPEGAPLVVTSRKLAYALSMRLDVPVALAMRYQHPSIEQGLNELQERGVERILLVPLYPHYAASSFGTVVNRVKQLVQKKYREMEIKTIPPFYDHSRYIEALAASAQDYLKKGYDHFLFSFHGLPERHLRKADPTHHHCLASKDCCQTPHPAHRTCYRAQVYSTVRAFASMAGLSQDRYSVAFQSRLGRQAWLQPYTDQVIVKLAQQGVRRLLVMCPAFVSDCLETLEEIGLRGRELFLTHGGQEFTLIPCLNDHPRWVDALEQMIGDLNGDLAGF